MRWRKEKKKEYKPGDKRIIKKFLLFPCTIKSETRWLETSHIKQQAYTAPGWPDGAAVLQWRDIAWVTPRQRGRA